MNEEFMKYRKLGITVLSKALDDICPTFSSETEEDKLLKIQERIEFYKKAEVELDKEWEELEKEATAELKNFIRERDIIFSKIAKTNNSERVQSKVKGFEAKMKARVDYLARKLDREVASLQEKLSTAPVGSKKRTQIEAKIKLLNKNLVAKIKTTESRYNTIIKNTFNSDNSERVQKRLEQSKEVWARKYNELREKHSVKELIHNNKRMELDQIRIAMSGFVHEVKHIEHWCTLADVTLRECYTEAIKRATMVNRPTSELRGVLNNIIAGV